MAALVPHEIAAVQRTIGRLQELATTMTAGIELGDLNVTIDILRELLASAEEHG